MAPPIQSTLREIGYATLGAGEVAAEAARNLTRAPFQVPNQLRDLRTRAPELVQKRYEELTDRGRKVAERLSRNAEGPAKSKPADKTEAKPRAAAKATTA